MNRNGVTFKTLRADIGSFIVMCRNTQKSRVDTISVVGVTSEVGLKFQPSILRVAKIKLAL